MKNIRVVPIILLFISAMMCTKVYSQRQKTDAIAGIWYNEEKTSKLQIYREGPHYFAKIVWLRDPVDEATKKPRVDNLNPNVRLRNRPLLGLIVLRDFVFDGDDQWEDGTIYDPNNGKTYSCYIAVDSPGKLKIRGYIGVSLLGRTTYWTRTTL